ncbi:MAG: hypothetical protein Q9M17_01430, partial [Mariprofundus sp.]|nr:hypothetical protein [Mariprofundus sp.]
MPFVIWQHLQLGPIPAIGHIHPSNPVPAPFTTPWLFMSGPNPAGYYIMAASNSILPQNFW